MPFSCWQNLIYLEIKRLATVFCFHWPVYEATISSSLPCFLVTQLLPPPPLSLSFSHPGPPLCILQELHSGWGAHQGAPFAPGASVTIPLGSGTCLLVHLPNETRSIWSEDHILLIWASLVTGPHSMMFTARMISKQWCIAVCLSASLLGWKDWACLGRFG